MIRFYKANPPNWKLIPCKDVIEWGQWFETANRQVARYETQDITVSTIFIGIGPIEEPTLNNLFETMVFREGSEDECYRYQTYENAIKGHNEIVDRLTNLCN